MRVDVSIKDAEVLLRLRNGHKRLAYAVATAINDTAKAVQRAEHARVRDEFVVRRPGFFFGTPARPGGAAGRIDPFASATRGRFLAAVSVDSRGSGKGGPVFLPLFEAGGERRPSTPGAAHVAVPLLGRPARPSIAQGVPPAFTFAGLAFRAYRAGKLAQRRRRGRTVPVTTFGEYGRARLPEGGGGGVQWKGRQRTFLVPKRGVFQRIGPDRGDIRLIYAFIPPFRLSARLRFVDTGRRVVEREFRPNLLLQIDRTLSFKR